MENGYIYTRVSTLIQVDGFSLDAQEEEIRAFAKIHGINIVGKYSDEGKSGKNAEHRPAFNQMMRISEARRTVLSTFLCSNCQDLQETQAIRQNIFRNWQAMALGCWA